MDQIAQPLPLSLKQAMGLLSTDNVEQTAVIIDVSSLYRTCKELLPPELGYELHERVLCSLGDCDALFSIVEDIEEEKSENLKFGLSHPVNDVDVEDLFDKVNHVGEDLSALVRSALTHVDACSRDVGSVFLTKERRLLLGVEKV